MRTAIITGGTKGIGLGIARMLLKEGYYVVITYAHDVTAAESCKRELDVISKSFKIIKADQSNKVEMHQFAQDVVKEFGTIECLICNAGTTLRKDLKDTSEEDWEKVMQVNVNSNVYLVRDLLQYIPNNSRIIFIGSLMAVYPHGTSLVYGVTKSAVHALAKNLVKIFDNTGTTVNAIAPGFVETEWQSVKPQYIRENIYKKTAIKRFAEVDEIADAVKFCINNPFVNGSVIEVSGGYCFA